MKRFTITLAAAAVALLPLLLSGCGSSTSTAPGIKRVYYIKAVEMEKPWEYAPKGASPVGRSVSPTPAFSFTFAPYTSKLTHNVPGNGWIGEKYKKARFAPYSATYDTINALNGAWAHLGIIGPPIKAEVGDTIEVHFTNATGYALNLHPEMLIYDNDDPIQPGERTVYTWTVPSSAGPGFNDTSSVLWKYTSTRTKDPNPITSAQAENAGLLGPVIIYSKGAIGSGYTPANLPEFVTVFKTFDENVSPYLTANETAASVPVGTSDPASNVKRTINGYLFGNMTTLVQPRNTKCRWYIMTGFTDTDPYNLYWEGNSPLWMQQAHAAFDLFTGQSLVIEMTPNNPATGTGTFPFYDQFFGPQGMFSWYMVR